MTAVDPVCGMPVGEESNIRFEFGGKRFWFCTEFCKQEFVRHPGAFEHGESRARTSLPWAERRVAYFTMEVALSNQIPTYAGGLGVLAGDTLRSMADLEVPAMGISLVHHKGYFRQELRGGHQIEHDAPWNPEAALERLAPVVEVEIEDRAIRVGAWFFDLACGGPRASADDADEDGSETAVRAGGRGDHSRSFERTPGGAAL